MSKSSIVSCPVDFIKINENKARLTAFFVLVLTLVYINTGLLLIVAFLLFDFISRAFNFGKYSLLGFISDAMIKRFRITTKPVDRAPKRFAAGVGVLVTTVIIVFSFLDIPFVSTAFAIVLGFFAMLESFFSFCAGCYAYSFGKKLSLFK